MTLRSLSPRVTHELTVPGALGAIVAARVTLSVGTVLLGAWLLVHVPPLALSLAQLPDIPPGIEALADAELDALTTQLVTVQADYVACNPRYAQELASHTTVPSNGNGAAPDRLGEAPGYQQRYIGRALGVCDEEPTAGPVSWAVLGVTLPASPILATSFDQYVAPCGLGYVVNGAIELAGQVWNKAIDVGCEAHRSHDWVERE